MFEQSYKVKNKIELGLHLLFWIFVFSAVNVDWTANWFDQSLRPKTPAALSVIMLPIYFYVHAFILIPRFFSLKYWKQYVLFAFILFILPEIIRIGFYLHFGLSTNFNSALFNRDSFLFGSPSVFFIALNASFIYRFVKDRLTNKEKLDSSELKESKTTALPYENTVLLDEEAVNSLKQDLERIMKEKALFLNPTLSLRELAESVGSTEKKVSYLINQHMNSNYYEWVNRYRIDRFKDEIAKPENKSLSIVGLALNCGFPSKSSFYRSFKSEVGTSPSEYLKEIKKAQ